MFESLRKMFGQDLTEKENENLNKVIAADKFVANHKYIFDEIEAGNILLSIGATEKRYASVEVFSRRFGFTVYEVNSAYHRVYGEPFFDYELFKPEIKEIEDALMITVMEEMEEREDTDGSI